MLQKNIFISKNLKDVSNHELTKFEKLCAIKILIFNFFYFILLILFGVITDMERSINQ